MKFKCLPNSIQGEKRCQQCADRNLKCKRNIRKPARFGVSPKHVGTNLTVAPEDASRKENDSSRVVVSKNVGTGVAVHGWGYYHHDHGAMEFGPGDRAIPSPPSPHSPHE